MDPIACVNYLGDLVFHAAAKDTRINPDNVKLYGVLDDRFTRTPATASPLNLGGENTLNQWPPNPSWEFVAVGRGHGIDDFWVPFLRALHAVDPDMAVNIEHEDQEFDQVEGLRLAAEKPPGSWRQSRRLTTPTAHSLPSHHNRPHHHHNQLAHPRHTHQPRRRQPTNHGQSPLAAALP
nr:hypothetical protein GCM10020092_048810 [Actinoplanes digitatis]